MYADTERGKGSKNFKFQVMTRTKPQKIKILLFFSVISMMDSMS